MFVRTYPTVAANAVDREGVTLPQELSKLFVRDSRYSGAPGEIQVEPGYWDRDEAVVDLRIKP